MVKILLAHQKILKNNPKYSLSVMAIVSVAPNKPHHSTLSRWLRDNFGLIQHSSEVSVLAEQVDSTGGVYFVPAFSGNWFDQYRKLKDNLGLIHHSSEVSVLAAQVDSTGGVYFVPAFSGNWFYQYSKLKDNLGLMQHSSEVSILAAQAESTGGVYFVPAFSGNWFNL